MTHADKAALGASLLMLVILYAACWSGSGPADEVTITAGGKTQVLPLNHDRRVIVNGLLGKSIIEIHHGRARFVASSCNGKICLHAGWLARTGDTAACVPNGVIVSISGDDSPATRYDAINF